MKKLILIGIAGLSLASCKTISKQYVVRPKSYTETQGTATFTQKKGKVEMDLSVFKLKPGLQVTQPGFSMQNAAQNPLKFI